MIQAGRQERKIERDRRWRDGIHAMGNFKRNQTHPQREYVETDRSEGKGIYENPHIQQQDAHREYGGAACGIVIFNGQYHLPIVP